MSEKYGDFVFSVIISVASLIIYFDYYRRKKRKVKYKGLNIKKYVDLILKNNDLKDRVSSDMGLFIKYPIFNFIVPVIGFSIVGILLFYMSKFKLFILFGLVLYFRFIVYDKQKESAELKPICFSILEQGINRKLYYQTDEGISQIEYHDAQFPNKPFDIPVSYYSSDFIMGNIENLSYRMSQVHTYKLSTIGEGVDTLFHGLFSVITLPHSTNLELCFFDVGCSPNRTRIDLENDEFNYTFDFFCSDHLNALSVVTPDIIEKIME